MEIKESRADLRYDPALSDEKRIAGSTSAIIQSVRGYKDLGERHKFIDKLFNNYSKNGATK